GKAVIEAGCSFDGRQLKGNDGDTFQVSCPAGCDQSGTTWGTGVYSANSPICRSGIHAGAIPATGGSLTAKLEPGRPAYRGSEQHGIKSSDFNDYNRSFAVVVAGAVPAAPAAADGKAVIEAGCSFDGRQLKGNDGDTFQVSCPAGCDKVGTTWGTGVYSANSPICRSGIHAGAIPTTGGMLTAKLEPGRPAYRGSEQHGIKSSDFNDYNRSYSVVAP
ncbi:MAG TPA: LCCL domain-containing protein, partial [Polyangiaceae bacterium]|nr:LCCL domain-containing protein [Polyangiaceae bacterium]